MFQPLISVSPCHCIRSCTLEEFLQDNTCGGTRVYFTNWSSTITKTTFVQEKNSTGPSIACGKSTSKKRCNKSSSCHWDTSVDIHLCVDASACGNSTSRKRCNESGNCHWEWDTSVDIHLCVDALDTGLQLNEMSDFKQTVAMEQPNSGCSMTGQASVWAFVSMVLMWYQWG